MTKEKRMLVDETKGSSGLPVSICVKMLTPHIEAWPGTACDVIVRNEILNSNLLFEPRTEASVHRRDLQRHCSPKTRAESKASSIHL